MAWGPILVSERQGGDDGSHGGKCRWTLTPIPQGQDQGPKGHSQSPCGFDGGSSAKVKGGFVKPLPWPENPGRIEVEFAGECCG